MCDNKTWELIKAEYIAGGTSYSALAKKYGTSKAAISRRSTAEGWISLAERVRNETETKVAERVSEDNADRFMQMYGIVERFQSNLADLMDLPFKNGRDAHDTGDAVLDALHMIRDLYNMPGEQQMQGRERLAIEREKLKLQKEANAAANGTAQMDGWVIHMTEEAADGDS